MLRSQEHSRLHKPFLYTMDGTAWNFLAGLLILPTGLITAAFLTRKLGPDGYGLFTLATTLIVFITITISSLFSRATVKLVSEADDWQPVGTTVLRTYLACGFVTAILIFFLADSLASFLGEPRLTIYLKLFAIEPLLSSLAAAHRGILINNQGQTEVPRVS